jgi:hypothetical protein
LLVWAPLVAVCGLVGIADAQQPAFHAAAELFILKVQVVAARGVPLPGLTAAQFAVRVHGRERRVIFAEFIRADNAASSAGSAPAGTGETTIGVADETLFQPFRNRAGALYLLGVQATDAERSNVSIKVRQENVTARRWTWCRTNCTRPVPR